jgi:hypothetical protein
MLKIPSLLVVLLLLLSACSSKTFTFSGESKNWQAILKVTQNDDGYEEQQFELHYKGNDIKAVGEITYDVDTNAGGFGISGATLDKNGLTKNTAEANSTNAKIIEESEVEVTVKWNDNTELITLFINK